MSIAEIDHVVKEYLKTPDTDYAIMISGRWGVGKTFFAKDHLQGVIAATEWNDGTKYKSIFVSLHGIKDTETLARRVLFARSGISSSDTSVLIEAGIDVFSGSGTVGSIAKAIRVTLGGVAKHKRLLQGYVLIFDDLERISTDLKIMDVLGYINATFIEHARLKTLFVANEDEITEKEEYDRIREKTIGRVIQFEPDLEEMLPQIINARFGRFASFYSLLNENKDKILHLCKRNDQRNLRVIFFALDILRLIHKYGEDTGWKDLVRQMITFVFLISFEFQARRLLSSQWSDSKRLEDVQYAYAFWKRGDKKETPYYVDFYERYLSDPDVKFEFYPSVFRLILTGYFDRGLFQKEIEERLTGGKSAPEIAIDRLLDFHELEMEELSSTLNRAIEFAEVGQYPASKYLTILSAIQYIKSRSYLEALPANYLTRLKTGLQKVVSDPQKAPSLQDRRMARLGSPGTENAEIVELQNILDEAAKQKDSDLLREKVTIFLDSLDKDGEVFGEAYRRAPNRLFELLISLQLQDRLLGLRNKGIYRVQAILHDRITRTENAGDIYYGEKQPLEELAQYVYSHIDQKEFDSMRRQRLHELVDYLREAAVHLENTRKAQQ